MGGRGGGRPRDCDGHCDWLSPPPPRGRVGGVVGGFWSTRRTRPYFYLICSHSLLCPLLCLHTKTGDCSRSLRSRTEGDGSGKPKAWEAAPRLTRRPALSSVFWRVDTGRGHGLEFDGGPQCSPPQSQVRPFFVDTCIQYPANNTTLSRLLGGSDPKTISKYVWPFIRSLFELNDTVVSIICLIVAFLDSLTFH